MEIEKKFCKSAALDDFFFKDLRKTLLHFYGIYYKVLELVKGRGASLIELLFEGRHHFLFFFPFVL